MPLHFYYQQNGLKFFIHHFKPFRLYKILKAETCEVKVILPWLFNVWVEFLFFYIQARFNFRHMAANIPTPNVDEVLSRADDCGATRGFVADSWATWGPKRITKKKLGNPQEKVIGLNKRSTLLYKCLIKVLNLKNLTLLQHIMVCSDHTEFNPSMKFYIEMRVSFDFRHFSFESIIRPNKKETSPIRKNFEDSIVMKTSSKFILLALTLHIFFSI